MAVADSGVAEAPVEVDLLLDAGEGAVSAEVAAERLLPVDEGEMIVIDHREEMVPLLR